MEERQVLRSHRLSLSDRKTCQMTGIKDVISFDANEVILETEGGLLLIRGEDLHMSHLSLDKGEVNVEGTVDSLNYSDSNKASKQAGNLIGRLFK